MKKVIILLVMAVILIGQAEAAEKLKIRQVSVTAAGSSSDFQISTSGVASKLISVDFVSGHSAGELRVKDGTSERLYLQTDHTIASFGPFTREDAPIFNTDIQAKMSQLGDATFVYIEME